jgi:hypothetical protein
MAHTYYGNDGLILTSITKENFDSGLSRVDCIYKCRTTKADDLEPDLVAGFRLPERPDYIIRENAKRKDDTDGFTTFTVSGFYGTLQISGNGTNPIPSVLGAATNAFKLAVNVFQSTTFLPPTPPSFTSFKNSYSIKVLSDTITKKFTLPTTTSVTTLPLPDEPLTYRVLRVTSDQGLTYDPNLTFEQNFVASYSGYQQTFFDPSFNDAIAGQSGIINVNRTNFGNVDEVTVTWGLEFSEVKMNVRQYFNWFNA